MFLDFRRVLIESRFMSDKIMPMTEAVEGYELFDKAKVQKGSCPDHVFTVKLITSSGLRGSEIGACLNAEDLGNPWNIWSRFAFVCRLHIHIIVCHQRRHCNPFEQSCIRTSNEATG